MSMKHEGPYRKDVDLEAKELEQMEKEVRTEGKFSIQLPKSIKIGAGAILFGDALKNNIDPKNIVFYSLATGILTYAGHEVDKWTKKNIYSYRNSENPALRLAVEVPQKKYFPAIISSLSTKATIEAEAKWLRENRKRVLINYMNKSEQNIQGIKKLVENDGKFPLGYALDEELKQVYVTELKELRTNVKLLLETIDDKLETTEKKE